MSQDDAVWHLLIDDVQRGPLKRSQLLASLRNGTIDGANLIWRPGFENWIPLREVSEFWTSPDRKSEITAPRPSADIPAKQLDEKWSLWGAATVGLALSSFALLTSGLTSRSYMLASTGYAPNAGLIGELIGELFGFPLLFVLIALIRNIVRRRSLRPSSVSAARRIAVFFGILIAVGISLRVFGTLYFSRDEIIGGDARDDFVKSFATGCFRSQRAAAVNAGTTDSQINGYCDCLSNSIVSTLSYRQLGAGNFMPDVLKAAGQAAPACKAKSFG